MELRDYLVKLDEFAVFSVKLKVRSYGNTFVLVNLLDMRICYFNLTFDCLKIQIASSCLNEKLIVHTLLDLGYM